MHRIVLEPTIAALTGRVVGGLKIVVVERFFINQHPVTRMTRNTRMGILVVLFASIEQPEYKDKVECVRTSSRSALSLNPRPHFGQFGWDIEPR